MTQRDSLVPLAVGAALALVGVLTPLSAQWTATITVEDTAGMRRTAFPASARFEVPEGRLGYVSQLRLVSGEEEVPSQGTAWSRWGDGSIREVEVDFNVSMDPLARRTFDLVYGEDVTSVAPSVRGLSVTEDERTIQVGPVTVNKGGYTLVGSVTYREEVIGVGRNGLTIVERSGIRRDPREIRWEPITLMKSGPLRVLAQYRGSIRLSGGSEATIALDMEMPNSKSWLKLSVTVTDPDGKVGDLGFETPLRLGDFPHTWDVGTPTHTYGAFRDPTGSTLYTRSVDAAGTTSWNVETGPAGSEADYESGSLGSGEGASTWAHMVGADEAVALVVEELTGQPGTLTMWLTGTGQTTATFRTAEPATEHAVTLYQHYVATPVPMGAATSPASILSPLRVTVD